MEQSGMMSSAIPALLHGCGTLIKCGTITASLRMATKEQILERSGRMFSATPEPVARMRNSHGGKNLERTD